MYPLIVFDSRLTLPTFFLIIGLAFSMAMIVAIHRAKALGLSPRLSLDLVLYMGLGGLVGGRVFHVLFEHPEFYLKYPNQIWQVWNGGFVFYGGMIFAMVIGIWIVMIKDRKQILKYFDLFTVVGSLIYLIGRVGCFLQGCCYGKLCDLPWAVNLPDELGQWQLRHPTQLYYVAWEAITLVVLLGSERKKSLAPGRLFLIWLAANSAGRFVIEFFRADDRGPENILSISGWISFIFLLFAGLAWIYFRRLAHWIRGRE